MKHRTAAILRHNNKFTSEMYLFGFQQCGAPVPCCSFCLPLGYSSSSCSKTYQCVNFSYQHFPGAVYLDATTSILNACATLEALDKYRYDTLSARYKQKHIEVGIAG